MSTLKMWKVAFNQIVDRTKSIHLYRIVSPLEVDRCLYTTWFLTEITFHALRFQIRRTIMAVSTAPNRRELDILHVKSILFKSVLVWNTLQQKGAANLKG
jgi:hypothetical protein